MALHVRHNHLPSPTRRVLLSGSAVACLCVAAILAAQSPIRVADSGIPASPLQLVTWTEQKEAEAMIRMEPIPFPPETAPECLALIDTTPILPEVDNTAQIDTAELSDESAPLITADLTDISEETAEATPKILPHKSPPNQDTDYTPPQYAAAPQPHYPKDLQRRRITGTVRVRIHINTQGEPTSVEILSSTHPSFSLAAKQAILTSWHFTPAKSGSTPVAASITTNINFALH